MKLQLLRLSDIDTTLQDQITQLYKQLNAQIQQLPLKKILEGEHPTIIICCKINGIVVGIALMGLYKVISGYKGMIEDVVVDQEHRGKGIGRLLMEALLAEGKKRNLGEILLFTGHHRLPAIQLYKSLGFKLKESGIYNIRYR